MLVVREKSQMKLKPPSHHGFEGKTMQEFKKTSFPQPFKNFNASDYFGGTILILPHDDKEDQWSLV